MKIQLLINNEPDRRGLQALLEDRYEVIGGESLQRADCYIIDDRTLPEYQAELREHKQAQHPTFCPVVLIQREDTRISVDLADRASDTDLPLIDETIDAPVDRATLSRRLDNLGTRRDQSLALTQQYEKSEARFEGLFAAIPDPAFVLDGEATITEVNQAFCAMFGVDRTDLIGRSMSEVGEIDLSLETSIQQVDSDEEEPSAGPRIVEFTDSDGETRYVTVSVQRVVVSGEELVVVVLTDITEVQEKTNRLEEFASIVAHDLRNPLQVARGRLPILREQTSDPDGHIETMERSFDRMEDLIDKLMLISQIGGSEVERQQVSLGTCIEECWQTVRTDGVDLEVDELQGVVLEADDDRMKELLENLFRNTVEHGGENVTVRVGQLPDGFYVEDTGPGIPEEKRDKILNIGYTTEPQGTGLGLNIVSNIVEEHGWELNVTESDEGGARFEITGVSVLTTHSGD